LVVEAQKQGDLLIQKATDLVSIKVIVETQKES